MFLASHRWQVEEQMSCFNSFLGGLYVRTSYLGDSRAIRRDSNPYKRALWGRFAATLPPGTMPQYSRMPADSPMKTVAA